MISDAHYIELWVNKQLVELKSQDSLNLRINNTLFNPTKTSTVQSEYSYSFSIPSTPNNDRILDYANNLSKVNKFRARYSAEVYADGDLIFDGSLTIQKYSAKDKMYTCNLVNIKINTLDEIFGDAVMTDVPWYVAFSGAPTINLVNSDYSTKYFFPLVSYGAFQKNYVTKDEVAATYTPKHTLDKYNKWWVESFYPSLNMLETMKKAFEWKGYTVQGSAFSDPNIANIYASCNLASEQSPVYNLGNPKFGSLNMTIRWTNAVSSSGGSSGFGGDRNFRTQGGGVPQNLRFPYERVHNVYAGFQGSHGTRVSEYNFDTIDIWNMMDSTNNASGVDVTLNGDSYMYDPNEMVVVIPADGWYKINLQVSAVLNGAGQSFTATQWTNKNGEELEKRDISLKKNLMGATPLEIQLIRNYDENVELIKGSKNVEYATGDPNDQTYEYGTRQFANKTEWFCDYPHQDLYGNKAATETEGLVITSTIQINENGNFGGSRNNKTTNNSLGGTFDNTNGYIHKDGFVMPYDQAVSPAFICGFSSLGSSGNNGTMAVMRKDSSWSKQCTINNKVFARVEGMNLVKKSGNTTTTIATDYCKNDYKNSSPFLFVTNGAIQNGRIQCCVYLNKNDILELVAVQRGYDDLKYTTSATCQLQITAMSDRSYASLLADNDWNYYSTTEFPTELNLFNFTNKETKVSDWISNVQKAFNLELVMDGNSVDINTNKGIRKDITYAVDIDDRVSSDEAEAEYISYPKEMSVQYKIDTEEWGFELTVPPDHINADDWYKWGDSGYTVIQLNDDTYETSTQNTQTNFSYTYYDNFLWKDVQEDGTETSFSGLTITIPVIEKAEYMAEGYGYEEAMKHDGYSLTQRFWYRNQVSQEWVWLSSILANGRREYVDLTYPMNQWNGFNLSYKDSEKSIATEHFNIYPMLSSNYVTVEVYLTPEEYKAIKGGALVHYDSDLYYCSEINGFDPSGSNLTKLKLIKKV